MNGTATKEWRKYFGSAAFFNVSMSFILGGNACDYNFQFFDEHKCVRADTDFSLSIAVVVSEL